MGLYTQRKPGIDGGKTATLEPEELEDKYFMLRVRVDGGALTTEQLRVIAGISQDFARDSADITDRQNIQLHWIDIESVPEIWRRLEEVGLHTTEACGDCPRVVLGSPVAGIAADEIIDPTEQIAEIKRRFIGNPDFSNLPRKYKTALTGNPGLTSCTRSTTSRSWASCTPSSVPATTCGWAAGCRRWPSSRSVRCLRAGARGGRCVAGRHLGVSRLRLPQVAQQGPAEVLAGRLGPGEIPPGLPGRVPRLRAP